MIANDVKLGRNVKIPQPELVNLYGCSIGDECTIGAFVEIRRDVVIGSRVKIQAFAFIPEGVEIGDGAFIGPHVTFTNDRYPASVNEAGELLMPGEWQLERTVVAARAAIGANATILCGVTIGEGATVGAGAVVVSDVPPGMTVVGNPARPLPIRRAGPGARADS